MTKKRQREDVDVLRVYVRPQNPLWNHWSHKEASMRAARCRNATPPGSPFACPGPEPSSLPIPLRFP